jgi:NodT family efflux transporter outer membrane factor (OMF) lipoprotein
MTAPRSSLRVSLAALLATSVVGCTVGPDFTRPDPPKDKTYLTGPSPEETVVVPDVLGGEAQRFVTDLDIPAQWWQVYQSRPLNDLIERSLRANPDIQTAIQSLMAAQETAKAQRAALFPTVTSTGSATHNQISNALSPATNSPTGFVFGLFTGLLNVTYLLDLWGGTRRAAESLEAVAESQCFVLEAAYLTLSSNVVVAAVTESSLRGQIAVTERTIDIQRQTLDLLQRRFAIGQAARADVATQEAALAQSELALPPLRNQLSQQRHLLAQLTGQTTAHVPSETFELGDLALPQTLPVSLPSRMVEQRPDVRAAEANLHSASALVGVAIANQFPQFTLNAGINSQSLTLDTLFGPGLTGSTIGVSILQTIIDGGALAARKRAAQAGLEQADAQYRSVVLQSFRNVADTLRALQYDAITLKAAVDADNAASTSLDIARRRLALGDTTYVFVLLAELTYQQALLTEIQAQSNRLTDTAALFQALGGGWWNREPPGPEEQARRLRCRPPTPTTAPKSTAISQK